MAPSSLRAKEEDVRSCASSDDDDDDDDVPLLLNLDKQCDGDDDGSSSSNKVPVTILSGFLGSGKTTLIQHILRSPDHHYKIAVIENEYGSSSDGLGGVESLIARDGMSDDNAGSLISLTELPNGCICCSVKDSLVSTLESLLRLKSNLDYIIIEASGMANPGPIAAIFWLDDALHSRLRLDGIVTMVDARNIHGQLRDTSSGGCEAERQIAYADRILINKVDLVRNLDDVIRTVAAINPSAPTETTTYSQVRNLAWILGADCLNLEQQQHDPDTTTSRLFCKECTPPPTLPPPPHAHTGSVQTMTLVGKHKSVNLQRTHEWLATVLWPEQDKANEELNWVLDNDSSTPAAHAQSNAAPSQQMRIFRCKGILSVELQEDDDGTNDPLTEPHGCPGLDQRRFIVQAVHDLWEIHPASENLRWKSTDERCSQIVVIGQWLDRQVLQDGFANCFVD